MVIVVASTATHITPRSFPSTARLIAARNRQTSAVKAPSGAAAGSCRAGSPPHTATTATAPITVSM